MENIISCKIIILDPAILNFINMQIIPNSIKLSISIIISAIFLLSCSSNALVITQSKNITSINDTKQNKTKKIYEKTKSQNKSTAKINIRIKKDLVICKVRPEPSYKKISFAKLRGGDVVEKIKEKGDWIKVDYEKSDKEKITGWIKNSDIEVAEKNLKNKSKLAQAKARKNSEELKEQLSPM